MFLDINVSGRQRRQRNKGYTLIEVLVAAVIFAAMIGLATMAFDQSLKQYRGLMEKGINFWDNARNLAFYRSFNCASDYYVRGENGKWFPYFHGSQDLVSYVTLSPMTGDVPVVVWIVKEALSDGFFDVNYYELPVYTKTVWQIERDYVFGDYKKAQPLKILEQITELDVSFYGYDWTKNDYTWTHDFEGEKKLELPVLIKLTYVQEGERGVMLFGIQTNSPRKYSYNQAYVQQ